MSRILLVIIALLVGAGGGFGLAVLLRPFAPRDPHALDLAIKDGGIYRVRKVVDGDTIALENGLHVRYQGVNAPEQGHFVKDAAPLASEATARNIQLVEGKRVRLRLGEEPLDIHGRIVARVFLVPDGEQGGGEVDVEATLLKEGLARSMGIGMTAEERRALKDLEQQAKDAKIGLWGLEDKPRDATPAPYCAAEGSNLYHLATCSVAQRIKAANRHDYPTIEAAEAVGLKPCSKCAPK